jgi:hypothetical protein
MKTSYTIEHHPHGVLVIGPVPLGDFAALTKLVPADGVLHSGVASYYGATLAMGGVAEMEQWAVEIEESVKNFEPPEYRFVSGTQHGVSSLTIVLALSKDEPSLAKARRDRYGRELEPDVPHDSADFGRCRKLLELRPDWAARMPEVAVKFPETKWGRLTPCWDELTALYDAKDYAKLDASIRRLVK